MTIGGLSCGLVTIPDSTGVRFVPVADGLAAVARVMVINSMNWHDIASLWVLFRANIVLSGYSGLAFGSALVLIALPRKGFRLSVETSDLAHADLAIGRRRASQGLTSPCLSHHPRRRGPWLESKLVSHS